MISNSLVVLIAWLSVWRSVRAQFETCQLDGTKTGRCVPIKECSTALAMLKRVENGDLEVANQLRELQCDSANTNEVYVCCSHVSTLNETGLRLLQAERCGQVPIDRIAFGEQTIPGEFPWMALLGYAIDNSVKFLCGGALITKRYVLTAAHCIAGHYNDLQVVRLGEYNITQKRDCVLFGDLEMCYEATDYNIEQLIAHPQFSEMRLSQDVGLLRLDRDVIYESHIRPVCLPITDISIRIQSFQDLVVAGWGRTEKAKASDVLLKATVTYRSLSACREVFKQVPLSEKQLCVGGDSKQDSCKGDSGSPLFYPHKYKKHSRRYIAYGIVSFGGSKCGRDQALPGVYTNVVTALPWITSNMT